METTTPLTLSVVGIRTGKPYDGKFTVNLVVTRREEFVADERRRSIVGTNPMGVAPSLNGEAFMLGQLYIRLSTFPDWWKNSDYGLDLIDENVIGELYKTVEAKIKEYETEIANTGRKAVDKLAKNQKAVNVQPTENQE